MTTETNSLTPVPAVLTEHIITVLLVDDQAMVGEAVRRMLAPEHDIRFHYCQDPTQAIQKALEISPTVILQDLVMPDIDGLTLVKYFRANAKTRDIPLIVLSTKEEPKIKADAFAMGANDYMVKLPDKLEVIARIRYHSRGYITLLQRNEIMRQLTAELAEAAQYVTTLLPPPVTEGPVVTDWRFIPSTSLGGDSFGYHWLDDDHFAIYLLDVCGHGVGAALLSVSVMNVLRAQTLRNTDFHQPAQVLTALNNSFQMDNQNGMYFTMWYGVYQKSTRRLCFASGGHPPALMLADAPGAPATVTELKTQNMIIGGMPDMTFVQDEQVIAPGNRVFLFSDGCYEVTSSDGKVWEFEEFVEFMRQPATPGVPDMDRLLAKAREINRTEILPDDFSILEVTFRG